MLLLLLLLLLLKHGGVQVLKRNCILATRHVDSRRDSASHHCAWLAYLYAGAWHPDSHLKALLRHAW